MKRPRRRCNGKGVIGVFPSVAAAMAPLLSLLAGDVQAGDTPR